MAGLKSLFRRKSKKDLNSDRSRSQTPEPGRSPSSLSSRGRTGINSSPPPPVPVTPTNLSPTQNKYRTSQTGFPPQTMNTNTSPMGGAAVNRYDNLPAGASPNRGSYPISGNNAVSNFGSQQSPISPTQGMNNTSRASNPAGRSPTTPSSQVPARRSVPNQGTAVSTDNSYLDRSPVARSNAYPAEGYGNTTSNRTAQNATNSVPQQPPQQQQQPGAMSQTNRSSGGLGVTDNRYAKHDRIVSGSSVASAPRTPIADEFAAPAWYKQDGSPPIPEFSPIHPGQAKASSPRQAGAYRPNDNPSYAANSGYNQSASMNGQTRDGYDDKRVTDRSADLARVTGSSGVGQPDTAGRRLEPVGNMPQSSMSPNINGEAMSPAGARRASIPRKSLEKPLPIPAEVPASNRTETRVQETIPSRERAAPPAALDTQKFQSQSSPTTSERALITPSSPVRSGQYMRQPQALAKGETRQGPQQVYKRSYLVEGAAGPPSLEGVVNLNNSVDTTTHVHYAPAIVHETVLPSVHHIREERVTREIHNYHVHHRILPIIDVQVLPSKHIVRIGNGPDAEYREIPEELVPGREHRNWVIAETVSRIDGPLFNVPQAPRHFTARTFEGTQGDYKEYVNADGVPTTETTWIHPPTISWEAARRGLTLPLDMD